MVDVDQAALDAMKAALERSGVDQQVALSAQRTKRVEGIATAVALITIVVLVVGLLVFGWIRTSEAARRKEAANCAAVMATPVVERQGLDVNKVCG